MADAKKILLLSGLGLGVLAVIAIASPGKSTIYVNPPPQPPGPKPPVPNQQGIDEAVAAAVAAAQAAYANFPGAPTPPPGQTQMPQQTPSGMLLPNPAVLVQGQRYKSRLELGALEASFATKDAIRNQFESLGFANVMVYTSLNELPPPSAGQAAWPPLALANATSRSRWVEGTWNQTTQSVAKPPQIQNAWTA